MTQDDGKTQAVASDQLSDAYREAVGSVMAARKLHDQACADQGEASYAAKEAEDSLAREIDHRNQLREQYDLILDRRTGR